MSRSRIGSELGGSLRASRMSSEIGGGGVRVSKSGSIVGSMSSEPFLSPAAGASDAPPKDSLRRSSWYLTAMNIMAEVMGTGVLSLPAQCAALGWVLGLVSCVMFGLLSTYAGDLLSRTQQLYPDEATSYADTARLLVGPRFGLFTRLAVASSWVLLGPYYLVATTQSFSILAEAAGISACPWQLSLVACACTFVGVQLRTMHVISYAAFLSTIAMFAAVAIILGSLIFGPTGSDVGPTSLWPSDTGSSGSAFMAVYGHAASFIFGYQGQDIMLEFMREMQRPSDFRKANVAANGVMVVVYVVVVVIAYHKHGSEVAGFLPESIAPGVTRNIISALLAFHTVVAYVVCLQPLHRVYHENLFPRSAAAGSGVRAGATWAVVTAGQLIFGFVFANAVPFFDDLQSLIGALTGTPIVFGWPALFYLIGTRLMGQRPSLLDKVLCSIVFLCLMLPVFTVLGTISAVQSIVQDWGNQSAPFTCDAM